MNNIEFDNSKTILEYENVTKKGFDFYKEIGLNKRSLDKVQKYLKITLIDININDEFNIFENFITLFELTFLRLKESIVMVISSEKWEKPFNHTTVKFNELLNIIQNNLISSFMENLKIIKNKFHLKDDFDEYKFSTALLIEAIEVETINKAHMDLASTIFKCISSYFITKANKEPDLNNLQQHYIECLSVFKPIIEEKVDVLEKQISLWISESKNLVVTISDYLKINNVEEFAQEFANNYIEELV